ncbi:MAG: peptide deformylase, partial [Lachnospiraceae bacterium]|nr:peptide deformylase [Lachnospiraceae bacterium]
IVKDPLFLRQISVEATREDISVANDLKDTLMASEDRCIGLAANMIGVKKRILVAAAGPFILTMLNPVIVRKEEPYEAEEGCLSLSGTRKCTRYKTIDVEYMDADLQKRRGTYTGLTAQTIQHEMDHFEGILI